MTKRALSALLLLVAIAAGQSKPAPAPAPKPETPHLRFVKEFVRELIEDEDRKTSGEKELSEAKTPNEQFSAGIYYQQVHAARAAFSDRYAQEHALKRTRSTR